MSEQHDRRSATGLHRALRAAWIGAAAALVLLALGAGATYVTALPEVCASCHEMRSSVATWRNSAHTRVGCPSCHETPRPWYRFPETLAERGAMFTRDVRGHFFGVWADSTDRSHDGTVTVSDETCGQCHDPGRRVSMRYGTLIDHAEHARRNRSCLSCHEWTAHPPPGHEKPLLMMKQCFTCHGREAGAKAPGSCETCHPASFEKRPVSHAAAAWRSKHGDESKAGRQRCTMCHDTGFCGDCHGLEMPHPAGWEKGRTGHGTVAGTDRKVCARCHTQKPDMCGMCHHDGYEPTKGTWLQQHRTIVAQRGVTFCLKCHQPTYCIFCHAPPSHLTKDAARP